MEFGFQGQFEDAETGWMNYGHRYYLPSLGRWACKDPIGESGGSNLYLTTGNSAINFVDYLGLNGGWGGGFSKLWNWVTGDNTGFQSYGEDSGEVEDMKDSSIAGELIEGFINKNKDKCCAEWQDYTNVRLNFGPKEFASDIGNGTAHFVGSASGDVWVTSTDAKAKKVHAKIQLTNTTSLKSSLYHIIPDSWNISAPTLGHVQNKSFGNWKQTYTWDEEFDCK